MLSKNSIAGFSLFLSLWMASFSYAQMADEGLGQTIQIHTRFDSFMGNPSWLLIIRDLDHNQNIPYVFDIHRGDNFWVAFTYGRNYLITVSRLYIEKYRNRYNTFKKFRTDNFCFLESKGHINRAESMYITIDGDLTPNTDSYACHVSVYPDANFTVVTPTQ